MTDESNVSIDDMTKIIRGEQMEIPEELPILDFDNFVLFPFMIAPLVITNEHHKQIIDEAIAGNRLVGVFLSDEQGGGTPRLEKTGCAAMILKMLKIPDGTLRILIHGLKRIHVTEIRLTAPWLKAAIRTVEEITPVNITIEALMHQTREMLQRAITMSNLPEELGVAAHNMTEPGKLADLVATNLRLKIQEQQAILDTTNCQERLERVLAILAREVEILEMGDRIRSKVKSQVEKNQKEFILREQLKAIHKELGEVEGERDDIAELKARLEKKRLPDQAREAAGKELKRMESMHQSSPEYTVSRTYLETILDLPWLESEEDNLDIRKAAQILDDDHYDLQEIKERILEYLSVMKLRKSIRGPILCFAGPPGVGKTSLGKSIARAMGRKFYHFSLGGMHDEAEIRGHRRTYIGAMTGRIISGLKICGCNNPVMMLDEIDKLGSDFRGDPSSALLEALDPEQNWNFRDHYLDLPFDLSRVMFITTANILDTIPPPLRDRMEILQLSGYTLQEKVRIARKYLIPKEYEANGVDEKNVIFTPRAIEFIIESYTREAGLRNLQRKISRICRKAARRMAEGDTSLTRITPRNVHASLGPPRHRKETARRALDSGVSVGLAWTPTGGEILYIESSATKGKGRLILTGQLGDVMKESAQAALTWLHSMSGKLKISEDAFSEQDIHVHVPAGAIPKDGPSAGVAICLSLSSLLLNKALKKGVAMTGEITLKGNVLPVGGIKEKVLAAHRAGLREIILPADNKKDLENIPDDVKREVLFRFASRMDEALDVVF